MAKLSPAPVIALIFLAFPLSAVAQNFSIGQNEFMNSCAHCHGASGKGDGIIAGYLNGTGSRPNDDPERERRRLSVLPYL